MSNQDLMGVPPGDVKPRTNDEILQAVIMMVARYKAHHNIFEWEVLKEEQIIDILNGIKGLIYKHEGIWAKK